MFDKIMVGVDGSKYAETALDRAINFAKTFDSKLLIVSVYNEPKMVSGVSRYAPYYRQPDMPIIEKDDLDCFNGMLNNYADKAKKAGVKEVETKIIATWDSVGAALVKEAEKQGCLLTVVGSKGVTGVSRLILGSVSEYLSRYTHCDVYIVRS
jgi:nucleotide-binding universal stress UspA family protein